jgi:hypothetical protein
MPYVEYDEVEAICSDCGRIFRAEEALAAHREEAHAGIVRRAPVALRPASTQVTCPVCQRPFDSSTTLRAHQARAHPR